MTRFVAACGEARLAGDAGGEGDCVVMLHAGVADRRMWRAAMAGLSPAHRTICYDRRGFGESIAPDEPFSGVDDLAAVLDHLACGRAVLIGCSQGGRLAIDFALAHPLRVSALVLVASAIGGAPAPEPFPPRIADLLRRLDEAEARGDIDAVNRIEAHLWLDGPLCAEGRVAGEVRDLFLDMNGGALRHPPLSRERARADAFARLGEITAPTLVVDGELDFPHVQARSELIASAIPGARRLRMAGCAHLPNLEQPDVFNRAVESFLRSFR